MVLAVLAFIGKGYKDEHVALHFRDFKQPYASARCILHGCDPYTEDATEREFVQAGGVDDDSVVFQAYSSLYPPPSLMVLTPIAALRYPVAHAVWFASIAVLFSIAAGMVAELCLGFVVGAPALAVAVVLGVFVFTSTILLMLGQISGPVISLLVIGACLLIQKRAMWLAVLCLSIALLLKPHDALLIVGGYLLVAGRQWRRAWIAVMVLCFLFTAGTLVLFAHSPTTSHWLTELPENLKGNSSPGNINNPILGNVEATSIADLKALVGTVSADPTIDTLGEIAGSGLLLLLWVVPVVRMRETRAGHVLALAALCAITPLLIYHRQYDTRLLLLIFPGTALLLARAPRWGWAALALSAVATLVTSHKYTNMLVTRQGHLGHQSAFQALLLYRPLPEIEVILAGFFIAALWMAWRAEQQGRPLLPEPGV